MGKVGSCTPTEPRIESGMPSHYWILKPTNVENLYLLVGISPSEIRRSVCARVERTKHVERETHSLFRHTPARSYLKLPYKCTTSSLPIKSCPRQLMEEKTGGEGTCMAPNDTAYKRWSSHSGFKLLCKLCRTSPPPAMGARFTVFWACRSCGPAGWLALLLTQAGDVETNPGPTTLNKKVWICDICHKQIHVRKQISIRCNRIEHWVHLRCAGIRQAQYTDTWTCHLHR